MRYLWSMSDTSRHLSYFKVENFKRFESFEMKDLGQFNLIVGDNNVGKTSVLEALLFDADQSVFVNNLISALSFRGLKNNFLNQDIELYAFREKYVNSKSIEIKFSLTPDEEELKILIDKVNGSVKFRKSKVIYVSEPSALQFRDQAYQYSHFGVPYIPFHKGHDEDLTKFYSRLQQNRQLKSKFISNLKTISSEIDDIELSDPYSGEKAHIIAYKKHSQVSLPLAMFGDGTIKLFRLLSEIVINNGKRLMIDEIDAGIHYSHYKEFWKTVLTAAEENDVQLFMTTHNEECIQHFKDVLENELIGGQKKSRVISLVENQVTKFVSAITYSFDQFEHALNVGNEIRG